MFNLIKVSTLIERMFVLTKSMGHETYMVFFVGYFDYNDHFDQMLNCTSSQKGQFLKMVHQDAHGLVKFVILNGHV